MREINFYSLVCFTDGTIEHSDTPVGDERLAVVIEQFLHRHKGHNLSMVVGVVRENKNS